MLKNKLTESFSLKDSHLDLRERQKTDSTSKVSGLPFVIYTALCHSARPKELKV